MRKLLIVLGVPVDDLTMPAALDRLDSFVQTGRATGRTHQVATINTDFVVKALDDPELRQTLQECDMATADGMPLVWGGRMLGVPLEGRVTGADLVPALAARAAERGYSLFLLGAAPGVAERAAAALRAQSPDLQIAGILAPPVQPLDQMDPAIVTSIRAAKPDILLVAFGNPKQEKWIARHAAELGVPVMIGVGGTLDFLAGRMRRAPLWMQRAGLEWLFRLLQEPGRLWRRYVVDSAAFGYFFARQWWLLRHRPVLQPVIPRSDTIVMEQVAILRLHGRLDINGAPAFHERALAALDGARHLVIDLKQATFLDSAALGALVGLAKLARERGGSFALAAAPPPIARILELVRLNRFFTMYEHVEQALAHLIPAPAMPPATSPALIASGRLEPREERV